MKSRIPISLVAIACSLALGACGTPASAAHSSSHTDKEAAMVAYAQCMRQHGVDLPDPGSGGGISLNGNTVDQATLQAAQSACRSKLPNGGQSTMSPAEQAQMQDRLLRFAACMRQHGVDMPDPQFNNNGGTTVQQNMGGLDPTSQTFKDAQKACQSLLPGKGSGLRVRTGGSGPALNSGGQ